MKKIIRHKKVSFNIDIAPLLDVMFMLLLFFLLTSSFLSPSIPLKLPGASNSDVSESRDIVVSVDNTGSIFLDRKPVSAEEFETRLSNAIEGSDNKRVVFRGDEKIIYGKFISVLDVIKSSGAKEIQIAHEQKK